MFKDGLTKDQILFLTELCYNVQNKNVEIPDAIKKKLKPYAKKFKIMSCPKTKMSVRREALKGGLLSVLLSTLASVVVPIILEKLNQSNKNE